jgi:type II secretion system (T2SS) protein K
MMMTNHRKTERGGAIIAVLWTSILIAMLLVGALAAVRVEARSARARAESLQAHAAAKSGLDLAAWRLTTGEVQTVAEFADAAPIEINGYEVTTARSRESRQIDINLAKEQTFATFFVFLGEKPENAQRLAARIADWRDRDDLSRPNGAERRDYINANDGETIGNRYFRSVDELKSVLDFPPALLDCARYALTIMGADGVGDDALLHEIYGASPFHKVEQQQVRLGTSGRTARAGSRQSITVTAIGPNGRMKSLTGLFRVTGGRTRPFEYIAVYAALNRPPETSSEECRAAIDDV